jgi:hypothetical protein
MQWAYEGMYSAGGELQVLLTTQCRPRCSIKAKVDPLLDSAGTGTYYFSCLTSAVDGVGDQRHVPAALHPRKNPSTHCGEAVGALYGPFIRHISPTSLYRTDL